MRSGWIDLLLSLRRIRRRPAVSLLIIVTLALGIGADTAAFTVVKSILLAPLPYLKPDRLALIWRAPKDRPSILTGFRDQLQLQRQLATPEMFRGWRARQSSFEDLAAIEFQNSSQAQVDIELGTQTQRVRAASVTPNFFQILGVVTAIGSLNNEEAVYISDGMWRRNFGSDPRIVGRTVQAWLGRPRAKREFTINGVLPKRFHFTYPDDIELWIVTPWSRVETITQVALVYTVIGRLKPERSIVTAQSELQVIADSLGSTPQKQSFAIWLEPMHEFALGRVRRAIALLAGITAAIFLVTCLSVMILIVARSADRDRELRTLVAIGASPSNIIRNITLDAAIHAAASGVLAVVVTAALQPIWRHVLPAWTPRVDEIALDVWTLGGVTTLVGVAVILVGVIPSILRSRSLRSVSNTVSMSIDRSLVRTTRVLIAMEMAVVMALLICGGWFIRSFSQLQAVDLGFARESVIEAELRLLGPDYATGEQVLAYRDLVVPRLARLPGVTAIAFSSSAPFAGDDVVQSLRTAEGKTIVAGRREVDPEFFEILAIPLRAGRFFTKEEGLMGRPVALLSETLSKQLFPDVNAIGRSVQVANSDFSIVGVVADVRNRRVDESPTPAFYIPWRSQPTRSMTALISVNAQEGVLQAINQVIREVDRRQPAYRISSLSDRIAESIGDKRLYAWTTISLGSATLIIALAGLCGVLMQSIAQRRRELGVRLAVGASPSRLVESVVSDLAKSAAIGVAAGALVSGWVFQFVKNLLFEMQPVDPLSIALAITLVLVAALVASLLAANRIVQANITESLRE